MYASLSLSISVFAFHCSRNAHTNRKKSIRMTVKQRKKNISITHAQCTLNSKHCTGILCGTFHMKMTTMDQQVVDVFEFPIYRCGVKLWQVWILHKCRPDYVTFSFDWIVSTGMYAPLRRRRTRSETLKYVTPNYTR